MGIEHEKTNEVEFLDLKQVLEFQGIPFKLMSLIGINMTEFEDIKVINDPIQWNKKEDTETKDLIQSEIDIILSSERPPSSTFQDIIHSDPFILSSEDTSYNTQLSFKRQKVDLLSDEMLTSEPNIITSMIESNDS